MCRLCLKIVTVLSILMFGFACSQSSQTYSAPEKKDLGDNQFEYIDSPIYAGSEAGAFDPELGTPEAAVVKYLSSYARGDDVWKDALIPESEWDDRLKRKLAEWAEWKVHKWQLKSISFKDDNEVYLSVWAEIEIDGDVDEGQDEFELIKRNGVWIIVYPPT